MILKKIFLCIFIFLFSYTYTSYYSGIIQCFIKPSYRELENKYYALENGVSDFDEDALPVVNYQNEIKKNQGDGFSIFKKPSHYRHSEQYNIARKILNRSIMGIEGVFGYYSGFGALSDQSGLLLFPRLEPEHELIIVITKEITPIITRGQIPTSFRVTNIDEARIYKLYAKDSAEGLMLEWHIEPIDFEQNGNIPYNALIIVSNPNAVYFEKEPQTFLYSENIMVPTLFATDDFTRGIYGMNALDTLQYFKPLSFINKESLLQKNIHFGSRFIDIDNFGNIEES